MVLQKKTLQLEKKGDNLKVSGKIQFDLKITMQVRKNYEQKNFSPVKSKIGLERVVALKLDKGARRGNPIINFHTSPL